MDTHRGENGPSTAPEGFVLPMLTPRLYQTVPRRYEETKLVVNQDFTHRKIIGKITLLYQNDCVIFVAIIIIGLNVPEVLLFVHTE